MKIIGAGLAGLLAARMLQHHSPQVIERQSSLPNNHSAVLRFRSSVVGDTLGIPFEKVTMIKSSLPWRGPVADALAYSFKNTGVFRSDRSIATGEVVCDDRYIAPKNLISRMAQGLDCQFGIDHDFSDNSEPCISTVPMPVLMKALKYPDRKKVNFQYAPAVNIRAKILACDAYVSLAVANPTLAFSRISITEDELIIEVPNHDQLSVAEMNSCITEAATALGIGKELITQAEMFPSKYAKILPIDNHERKTFIHWATDNHNVFSLGRFATWRPGLLLDDLVNDVRLIERWINSGRYEIAKHR